MTRNGIEQIDAAGHVGGVKSAGFAHGFGHQRFGGKMHHRIDFILGENLFNLRAHREVHIAKNGGRRHGGAVAFDQAVQRHNVQSAGEQDF